MGTYDPIENCIMKTLWATAGFMYVWRMQGMSIFLDPRTRMIASSSTYIDICFSLAVHACGNIGMMDSLAARVWPIYLPLLSRLSTSFSIRSDLERISTLSFRLCTLVVRSETRALRSANCSLLSAFNSVLRSLSPPWICWRATH